MINKQNNWRWGLSSLSTTEQKLSLNTAAFDKQTLNQQTKSIEQELTAVNKDRTQTENAKIDKDDDGFLSSSRKNKEMRSIANKLAKISKKMF